MPTDNKVGHKVVRRPWVVVRVEQYAAELAERGYVTISHLHTRILLTTGPTLENLAT